MTDSLTGVAESTRDDVATTPPDDVATLTQAFGVNDAEVGEVDTFDVDPAYDVHSGELPDDRFLDRELSWLRFNQRVLELAEDESVPLLERVRLAAFVSTGLDEFFMVRVAGLKRRIMAGVAVPTASGLQPRE